MEVAPENWINVGGQRKKFFDYFTDHFPFVCHGLSLSIGGPSPLDRTFIQKLRQFMDDYQIRAYSEHLSYCTDDGHLYDLMPIPFTEEAVSYVAGRIGQVQDMLGQRMAIENVSYYAAPGAELSEIDFINAVINEADCDLLLDVNNIYVNSVNHCYDPVEFLRAFPESGSLMAILPATTMKLKTSSSIHMAPISLAVYGICWTRPTNYSVYSLPCLSGISICHPWMNY